MQARLDVDGVAPGPSGLQVLYLIHTKGTAPDTYEHTEGTASIRTAAGTASATYKKRRRSSAHVPTFVLLVHIGYARVRPCVLTQTHTHGRTDGRTDGLTHTHTKYLDP